MQRFMPVELAIFGDAESSLPALTEAVKAAIDYQPARRLASRAINCAKNTSASRERARSFREPGLDYDTGHDRAPRR